MRQFIAPTEDFIKTYRTYLDGDFAAASDSINVDDNAGLANNDWLLIGFEGSSQAELVRIIEDVVPGEALAITETLFKHTADEPVQKFAYDQRKFYGCTTVDGSYTELTGYGSPTNINVTDPSGTLFEYNGMEGYLFFKATYYNSNSDVETDIADSNAIGSDQTGRYCTIYDIRNQAGLTKNPYITG